MNVSRKYTYIHSHTQIYTYTHTHTYMCVYVCSVAENGDRTNYNLLITKIFYKCSIALVILEIFLKFWR